jgi:dolichol kinase
MFSEDVARNVTLMLLCYAYILFIIIVSGKMPTLLHVSPKASRKFLHAMIGNLPFIIPFFTESIYPVLVAAPFILVTFIASPVSPFKDLNRRLKGLANITEEGHHLGLVFYAISYTVLALFFASKPYVIAAGILPMAYGDSAASLVGERYGRIRYKLFARRSLEGSATMFMVSFLSFVAGLIFFSRVYSFSVLDRIVPALALASVTTLVEALSPKGSDNLTVPMLGALTFLILTGGA